MSDQSLYQRLGGYDAIAAVAHELVVNRLQKDAVLKRFWENRGQDGIERELQLLIDYLAHQSGGPMYYTGRDMKRAHLGMGITEQDWSLFLGHLADTLSHFNVPDAERDDVTTFIGQLKAEIID